jgi:hemolysin activation/secretion protein
MLHGVTKGALLAALLLILVPGGADAEQSPADRADVSVIRDELGEEPPAPSDRSPSLRVEGSDAAPQAAGGDAMLVGAIRVEGATLLTPAAFAPAIEPYLGRPLGPSDLRGLATDVANVARRAGYGLASAWIPPQTVANGILRVTVDEGRIDAVEASGAGKASVERMLAQLARGRPVRTADLERQLLLAGDIAGLSVGRARLERRDGRNILRVEAGRERAGGRASIDNWGSGTLGPVRARLDIDINGVMTADDRVSVGGVLTPAQPKEFQFVRLAYSLPVNDAGTEISLAGYVGHSRPGGSLRDRDLDGTSVAVEAAISHPLLRSRTASVWGSLEFGLRDSSLKRAGVPSRDDRIAIVTAAVRALGRVGDGWLRTRLALVQGVDALGATGDGDPLASRPDGSAVFTKLAFSANYTTPLADSLGLAIGMEGQLASRPLLASEEMGLGGRSFIRAYDYREVSGDTGAAASAELRYDFGNLPGPFQRAQAYAYGDAGTVGNLRGGSGGGSLASAGGGMRVWLREGLEAGVELGVPLGDSPLQADPKPRFSFSLGYVF